MKPINAVIFFILFCIPGLAHALPRAVLVQMPTNYSSINAVAADSASKIKYVIENQGRIELQYLPSVEGARTGAELQESAAQSGADMIIIVSVYQQGPVSYGELKITALNENLSEYNSGVRVKSEMLQNIPLLLQRELVVMTEKLPVIFSVTERTKGFSVIDAGSYSGLENGNMYTLQNGNIIEVVSTGRFHSIVKGKCSDTNNRIELYSDSDKLRKSIDEQITENIIRKYGAGYAYLKNTNPDRRYFESLFVVNPFGNIVIPGYGAYLSTYYMDFESPKPSYASMGACASLYLFELLYIPSVNGFNVNFFPWIQDPDKSDRDLLTQQYLWAMIPFTFTACYLDQLAVQYKHSSVLPPGLENPVSAGLHSLLIPGGGLFYKGYRTWGWAYFGTEFALGMYTAMNWKNDTGKYALYTLGAVKLGEIIHAVLIKPDYSFYTREKYNEADFRVTLYAAPENDGTIVYAGAGTSF